MELAAPVATVPEVVRVADRELVEPVDSLVATTSKPSGRAVTLSPCDIQTVVSSPLLKTPSNNPQSDVTLTSARPNS